MGIAVTVLIALAAGAAWALALRGLRRRRQLIEAPRDVTRVLRAYAAGRWDAVIAGAPACLERDEDPGDGRWRSALELALGHALVQRDRCSEAIVHLRSGLRSPITPSGSEAGGAAAPRGEAEMRHMLGYALAVTGRAEDARREYRAVLSMPGLDPGVRRAVDAALSALEGDR